MSPIGGDLANFIDGARSQRGSVFILRPHRRGQF
jgi:hypothetical protein